MGLQKIIISLSWQIYSETAPCVQTLFFHIRDIKYDSIKPFSFEIYKIVNYYSKLSKIINIHGIWIFIRPNISIFGGIFSNSPNIKKYLCPNPTCLSFRYFRYFLLEESKVLINLLKREVFCNTLDTFWKRSLTRY